MVLSSLRTVGMEKQKRAATGFLACFLQVIALALDALEESLTLLQKWVIYRVQ